MNTMPYLENLSLRLAAGGAELPEEMRARHAAYLIGAQRDDGGFAGRQGAADLYYTSFALRALAIMHALDDEVVHRSAGFLTSRLGQPLPSMDFLSLVISAALLEAAAGIDVFADAGLDRKQTVIDFFEPFRREDGGYAKTQRGGAGSTYHTFLVAAGKQMIGAPLEEEAEGMVRLVRSRQRADGGFVEIAPMRHSGTNPTAAAVGLLRMLGSLDEPTRAAAARFLGDMQNEEGGLRANTRIPVADLLSTFTGLVAMNDLDALWQLDGGAVRRFVESLQRPEGGFRAGTWDETADAEYTFYGLGTLALLSVAEG